MSKQNTFLQTWYYYYFFLSPHFSSSSSLCILQCSNISSDDLNRFMNCIVWIDEFCFRVHILFHLYLRRVTILLVYAYTHYILYKLTHTHADCRVYMFNMSHSLDDIFHFINCITFHETMNTFSKNGWYISSSGCDVIWSYILQWRILTWTRFLNEMRDWH